METITNLTFPGASGSGPSTSIPYWKNGQGAMIENLLDWLVSDDSDEISFEVPSQSSRCVPQCEFYLLRRSIVTLRVMQRIRTKFPSVVGLLGPVGPGLSFLVLGKRFLPFLSIGNHAYLPWVISFNVSNKGSDFLADREMNQFSAANFPARLYISPQVLGDCISAMS
ncbi:hypothetical protein Tco_0389829 [Tanacetum coccineum]